MESSQPARVLVVAHKTAATQPLLDAVRERAQRGPASFTLLVPNARTVCTRSSTPRTREPGEAQQVLDEALPRLSERAGSEVEGIVGDPDPSAAVQDAINLRGFDEIIISTLSPKVSRWLKLDLPSKVSGMGLPVTTVTPATRSSEQLRPPRRTCAQFASLRHHARPEAGAGQPDPAPASRRQLSTRYSVVSRAGRPKSIRPADDSCLWNFRLHNARVGTMENVRMQFAANLRHHRDQAGLSQEALADLCDLHRTEISLLERCKRSPRLETIVILSRGLKLSSPGELLEGIR